MRLDVTSEPSDAAAVALAPATGSAKRRAGTLRRLNACFSRTSRRLVASRSYGGTSCNAVGAPPVGIGVDDRSFIPTVCENAPGAGQRQAGLFVHSRTFLHLADLDNRLNRGVFGNVAHNLLCVRSKCCLERGNGIKGEVCNGNERSRRSGRPTSKTALDRYGF